MIDALEGFDFRPLRIPLSILGMLFIAASFAVTHGWDLHSYWRVDLQQPYDGITSLNDFAVFRYAPPIALLSAPLAVLPFEVLALVWLLLQVAALWYIGRGWALVLVLFPPVWLDIVYGNVYIFYAAMIVAGRRLPEVWLLALLTKVTPAVGVVWYVVRREWRAAIRIVIALGVVVAISVLVQGWSIWLDWFGSLDASRSMTVPGDALPVPLIPRLVVATLLVAWGAWTDRAWVLPVAVVLATPTIWVISLAPLVALWPRDRVERHGPLTRRLASA